MFERVKKILVEQLGVDGDSITLDTVLGEEFDSLSVMQVIMELEEEFGMTIEDDDVNKLRTVGDIVAYCEEKSGK